MILSLQFSSGRCCVSISCQFLFSVCLMGLVHVRAFPDCLVIFNDRSLAPNTVSGTEQMTKTGLLCSQAREGGHQQNTAHITGSYSQQWEPKGSGSPEEAQLGYTVGKNRSPWGTERRCRSRLKGCTGTGVKGRIQDVWKNLITVIITNSKHSLGASYVPDTMLSSSP